jgi:hypothetical protein
MHSLCRGLRVTIASLVALVLAACQASGATERHGGPASFTERTGPMVFDARTLVIGNHAGSVAQVMHDLRDMGFVLIEGDRVGQIPDGTGADVAPAAPSENELRRRGFLAGAEMLVIVRIDGSRQIPAVRVTGIDIENGTILWRGGVVSNRPVAASDYHRRLVDFARQALMRGMMNPDSGIPADFSHH